MILNNLKNSIFLLISISSCSIPILRKVPEKKYYLRDYKIDVKGGKFTKTELSTVKQRLSNQLEDSSKVPSKDVLIIFKVIKKPPVYDSASTNASAKNMQASMFHLGYYNAKVTTSTDTSGRQIFARYIVQTGKPTTIDTINFKLKKPDLQQIALASKEKSLLQEGDPITKNAVLGEINRLVDSFRNNGYYKFTASELKVRGDTTIEALTNITDDPFEQLQILAEAQQKRDSPKIKLAVVINPPSDTSKLSKYYIRKIFVLSDYWPNDDFYDSTSIIQRPSRKYNFIHRYHQRLFRNSFIARNISMRSGSLYRQEEYYNTLTNLSQAGVWQSVNIRLVEAPDSANALDVIIELIPARKFGFEAALELSYSTSTSASAVLGGNLFGISGNLSLTNRNMGREAIRMTHKIRAGIELNSGASTNRIINSNEIGYINNVVFPRLIIPNLLRTVAYPFTKDKKNFRLPKGESFINTSLAYNNRLDLFNMQSINMNMGWTWMDKRKLKWEVRPFNLGFSYLFNQTDSFNRILFNNPFLKYSYNTAYVVGMGFGVSNQYFNPRHRNSLQRERNTSFSFEESGLTWANFGIAKKYLRRYVKFDGEYRYTVSYKKTALAFRMHAGVGIPLGNRDTTLPFFKQYSGGGSNSMRGWPIRGIGIGGQPMQPFNSSQVFKDRTGDMQLEGNIEYRYDIARIIPNTLTLRGALFADVGNIWNIRNSKADGSTDSTQFRLKNLYSQLGVSAGTGFRLDFNYFVLRFDFGFRFKRPELYYINNGWKAPSVGFDNLLNKIFAPSERQWRYENFNFTVGISYPF